jgi:hypothetical protein
MKLHETTFAYHKPSDAQVEAMTKQRKAAADYAAILQETLPDGPDKTYCLRTLRTVAMWANVAIDREADGSPRQ